MMCQKKNNKNLLLKVILFIKRLFFFSLQKGNSLCIPSASISHQPLHCTAVAKGELNSFWRAQRAG